MGRGHFLFAVSVILLAAHNAVCENIDTSNSDAKLETEDFASEILRDEDEHPFSFSSANLTERVEELAMSADAVQIFMAAIERVVMEDEDVITIPEEIDPEQHNITLEDAFSRLNEFLTEQMDEAQNLFAEIENKLADQNPEEYLSDSEKSFSKENSSYSETELQALKEKILDVLEVITDATEDLSDYMRSKSILDYDYYDQEDDSKLSDQEEEMDMGSEEVSRPATTTPYTTVTTTSDFDTEGSSEWESPLDEAFPNKKQPEWEWQDRLPSESYLNLETNSEDVDISSFPTFSSDSFGDKYDLHDDTWQDPLPAESSLNLEPDSEDIDISSFPTFPSDSFGDKYDLHDDAFDSDTNWPSLVPTMAPYDDLGDDINAGVYSNDVVYDSYSDYGHSTVAIIVSVPVGILFTVLIVWLRVARCRRVFRRTTVIRRTVQVPVTTRVAVVGICESRPLPIPVANGGLPSYLEVVSKNVYASPPPRYESCATSPPANTTVVPPPPDYTEGDGNVTSDVARLIP